YQSDLHSFPTRRSSDLYNQDHFLAIVTPEVWSIDECRKEIGNIVQLFGGLGENGRAHVSVVNNNLIGSEIGKQNRMFMWTVRTRSEEHTSELQSRENLV